jgi:quinohemoprotein ethanol dehydrogenase
VFQGLRDGRLVAYTADTGDKVWEVNVGNAIMAAPSTYLLDGRQYVSVLVGWGGATADAWRFAPQRPTPGPVRTDRRWSFGLTPYTLWVLPSTCHVSAVM